MYSTDQIVLSNTGWSYTLDPPSLAKSVNFVGVMFIYSETTAYCDLRGVRMIPFQCRKILAIARPFDVIFCKFPFLRGIWRQSQRTVKKSRCLPGFEPLLLAGCDFERLGWKKIRFPRKHLKKLSTIYSLMWNLTQICLTLFAIVISVSSDVLPYETSIYVCYMWL